MKAKIYEWAKIVNKENFSIGDFSQIDDFVFLNAGEETLIGRFVHISSFCSVTGGGKFYMEDFSGFSAGCRVITGSDDFTSGFLTNPTVPAVYTNVKRAAVRICKHAIVGTNVIIFPGVTIGEGAAVGAGCIVRKDLEPWTAYVGQDCRPLKSRDEKSVRALEQKLLNDLNL
jgi:acetyltransferase-like isoleucine patch superfamily enzyme